MKSYYLENLFINDQEDRARINLLKCSQSLSQSNGDIWNLKLTRSIAKINTRNNIHEYLKSHHLTSGTYQASIQNLTELSRQEERHLAMKKQKIGKPCRRFTTEYQYSPQNGDKKQLINDYTQVIRTIDAEEKPFFQPFHQIGSKSRSNTVLIHMLKNKSTNINIKPIPLFNEHKIIHNLSGIKVRMMAKKMEESKNLNLTEKQIKQRLDQITSLQSYQKSKQKCEFKIKKGYLKQILSKRQKFKSHKQNLKVYQ